MTVVLLLRGLMQKAWDGAGAQGGLGRVGWGEPTGLQGSCGGGGRSLAQEMEARAQATSVAPGRVE